MEIVQKKVPQLRFPEFYDEWHETSLGNIADVYDGTHQTPDYVDEGVPFVSVESINNIENSKKYITREAFEKNYKIKPQNDDILMTRITAGIIGATAIVKNNKPLGFYVSLALIRMKNQTLDVEFLNHRINSVFFKHELHKRIIHIAFPKKINLGEIGKCRITFTKIEEQQKIASFLTEVDTKIIQLTRKKELLEQYKKGIIQQLFSQEIRFKNDNGKDFPNWAKKRLSNMGKTLNGLSGKTKDNFGNGKPYIQYKQIFDNSKINISNCGLVEIKENENQTKVQYGDVFFTTSSETPMEIGTTSVLLDKVDEMYLNSFCFGLRVDEKILYPSFAQFLFRTPYFRRKMIPLAQGSTRYNISKTSFMKLEVMLPLVEEQIKIASFLSAIDDKINYVGVQLEKTKLYKNGLLQQMFV